MHRAIRLRTATSAYVATALSLALVTGCSSSSESSSDSDASSPGAKETTAAAKALGEAELEKLIITTADVKGYEVGSADQSGVFAESKEDIEVEPEVCAPIAYVVTGFTPGDSAADVNRLVQKDAEASAAAGAGQSAEDALAEALAGATVTMVSLSSHDDAAAARATMIELTTAVQNCADGFTATEDGNIQTFTKVEKEEAAGGEAIAFAVTGDADGEEIVVHGEVALHGATIATYYSLSLAGLADGTEAAAYDIPADIIKAQAAKLD